MVVVHSVDPYLTFVEPTFVARFLHDPEGETTATWPLTTANGSNRRKQRHRVQYYV
jgi:hypothetical protein